MRFSRLTLLAGAALLSGTASAQTASTQTASPLAALPAPSGDSDLTITAHQPGITARQRAVPPQLSIAARQAYGQIFRDIDAGRFAKAEAGLAAIGPGLLTDTARAQIMIARGVGKLSRAELAEWLAANRDMPQAPRIAQLAAKLPAPDASPLPALALTRPFRTVTYAARAELSAVDTAFAAAAKPLLAVDRNAEAADRWRVAQESLSNGTRTEWAQRIAWSYYGQNDNAAALQLGAEAAKGLPGPGQFAALGAWTAGLAAFRSGQYDVAARMFDLVGTKNPSGDLAAAAAFWASRAWLAAGNPDLVAPRLEAATKAPNSFYGLLARRTLGLAPVQDWAEPDFITADWNVLKNLPGARRAAALMEIGQIGLGDRELRFLAQTAPQTAYPALLRLAARLGLPATQYSLAVRPPIGIDAPLSARFPAPDWVPARGWRVDRGLVFAHALQESTFITTATSRTGAKGIMQLMPGTAKQVKAEMNGAVEVVGDLADPAFNIEVGQTYLEALRDMSYTQGLLPKVVAAYNAGPGSVQRWNTTLDDRGDPLLFIESIPFKETRHYVEVVLRNLWMYQLRDGTPVTSMDALAAGLWPRFPGMPGAPGIKRVAMPMATPAPGVLPPLQPPPFRPVPVLRDDDDYVTSGNTGR
ncbi:lytic transglycosylase domain-containing protein [Polymorphobacter fuscus]|uniref:Transglycosylase SLT domain-containing protein n=1 Tax=Sandarakinorhabdus fusca TaxID=1439888 RepID=A0A7C9KH09_9SPHN|nr:lytic transglycosylase domain-containing protein [Polymorphobacter fuscus]KAB7648474.1 lytic transglycosylase domain-containing protein [Polymorphobacter fuscus]MQT15999.1 transglycosylase SLT domain-containing protein [Polymorphobacter fuscus]NJC07724.1 soluble lytic murein transglycosylase-like protein [Polymorphobacter fuscus]